MLLPREQTFFIALDHNQREFPCPAIQVFSLAGL
jgi:hypothetical protein